MSKNAKIQSTRWYPASNCSQKMASARSTVDRVIAVLSAAKNVIAATPRQQAGRSLNDKKDLQPQQAPRLAGSQTWNF
jgi:hypothetical protein